MRVLVTGAAGFVGTHLLRGLQGHRLIAASRRPIEGHEWRRLADLDGPVDWDSLLADVDAVVHLAGIAHRVVSEAEYDRANHRATAELCAAARRARLTQVVFVSSIGAEVGHSSPHVVTEDDPPAPVSAYGRSKLAAEQAVARSGVPFTILRPVLVIGAGAKANAAALEKLAALPLPLPLGALTAKRSFLSVENLVSAVSLVLEDPRARGETYIVADRTPLSVSQLIARLRAARGRRPGIFTLPGLATLLRLPGAHGIWERVGEPLVASPAKLLALGWSPTR